MAKQKSDTGLRFPDYYQAEIKVTERVRNVYVTNGVSYPTKKAAVRASWEEEYRNDVINRQDRAEELDRYDSIEDEEQRYRSWRQNLPYSIAGTYETTQEVGQVFQVISSVDGKVVINEAPTLQMAEEGVRAVENKQRRQVNEIVDIYGAGVERSMVEREFPELAELIRQYTYEEMTLAYRTMYSRIANIVETLKAEGADVNITLPELRTSMAQSFLASRKDKAVMRAVAREFAAAFYQRATFISREINGDDEEEYSFPIIEIVLEMIDYERVWCRAQEKIAADKAKKDAQSEIMSDGASWAT